jgi:hypothetical protein
MFTMSLKARTRHVMSNDPLQVDMLQFYTWTYKLHIHFPAAAHILRGPLHTKRVYCAVVSCPMFL